MIFWINGPYGVGKSTLAEKLHEMNPNSFIFDAEEVGNAVRGNLPPELFNGYIFKNYPMWHRMCSELLLDLLKRYQGDIYIPMTLVYEDSYEKIMAPIVEQGYEGIHILLESSRQIVHDRILARGENEDCWCMQNIELCLDNQKEFTKVIRIESRGRTVEQLAEQIVAYQSNQCSNNI